MDPTLRGMLNAVIAEPEQDHLRLICADRYEELEESVECGQCGGVGFLRYCDAAGSMDTERCHRCKSEGQVSNGMKEIADRIRWQCEHPREHLHTDYPEQRSVTVIWSRGFVSEARCTMAEWEQHGPAICDVNPVEKVVITDKEPYVYTDPPGTRVYTWYRTIGSASRHCVRPEIFDCHGITKKFPSSEESYDWLSRRCIETARAKAAALSAV